MRPIALPRTVSTKVRRQLDRAWYSVFVALEAWKAGLSTCVGLPHLPGYKDQQTSRNLLTDDIQALGQSGLQRGEVLPCQLGINVRSQQTSVKQVRLLPRRGYYVVAVVCEREPTSAAVDPARCAGLDRGHTTLVVLTS